MSDKLTPFCTMLLTLLYNVGSCAYKAKVELEGNFTGNVIVNITDTSAITPIAIPYTVELLMPDELLIFSSLTLPDLAGQMVSTLAVAGPFVPCIDVVFYRISSALEVKFAVLNLMSCTNF